MFWIKIRNCSLDLLVGTVGGLIGGILVYLFLVLPFAVLIDKTAIEFDPLTLVLTVLFAVYISRFLNRKDGDKKVERELIISYLMEFEKDFSSDIKGITSKSEVEGSLVAETFKKHSMSLEELKSLVLSQRPSLRSVVSKVELSLSSLREFASEVPDKNVKNSLTVVRGTKLAYKPLRIHQISSQLSTFKVSVFELVVGINRA